MKFAISFHSRLTKLFLEIFHSIKFYNDFSLTTFHRRMDIALEIIRLLIYVRKILENFLSFLKYYQLRCKVKREMFNKRSVLFTDLQSQMSIKISVEIGENGFIIVSFLLILQIVQWQMRFCVPKKHPFIWFFFTV